MLVILVVALGKNVKFFGWMIYIVQLSWIWVTFLMHVVLFSVIKLTFLTLSTFYNLGNFSCSWDFLTNFITKQQYQISWHIVLLLSVFLTKLLHNVFLFCLWCVFINLVLDRVSFCGRFSELLWTFVLNGISCFFVIRLSSISATLTVAFWVHFCCFCKLKSCELVRDII